MKRFKTLVVTGGKGGTGKSTVAILVAKQKSEAGKKVLLVDADVECPNDFLLLGVEKGRVVGRAKSFLPVINRKRCQRCGRCVEVCRANALFKPKDGYPLLVEEQCSGCGACWLVCPAGAIERQAKVKGRFFLSEVKEGWWLLTGELEGVVEESGPVVAELKKEANRWAERLGVDWVVVDTAAGTHCSVMRAIEGADEALAVTEPTPLGASDLKLILEILKLFRVPTEVVVNPADLGDLKLVEKVVKEKGVKKVYPLPYSALLAKAYAAGRILEFKDERFFKEWPER